MGVKSYWQDLVGEFHRKFGCPIGQKPGDNFDDDALMRMRVDLVREECSELEHAVLYKDLPKTIDALCDIIYVVMGMGETLGVDLAPFYVEVHKSNMQKDGGGKRSDGKILKPPGWVGPDIKGILKRQMEKAHEVATEWTGNVTREAAADAKAAAGTV